MKVTAIIHPEVIAVDDEGDADIASVLACNGKPVGIVLGMRSHATRAGWTSIMIERRPHSGVLPRVFVGDELTCVDVPHSR